MIDSLKIQLDAAKELQWAGTTAHDLENIASHFAYRPLDRICYRLWNSCCHLAPSAREGGTKPSTVPIKGIAPGLIAGTNP
jgi:hypothetical protein